MIKNCIIFVLLLAILLTGLTGAGLYWLNDDFRKEADDIFRLLDEEAEKID